MAEQSRMQGSGASASDSGDKPEDKLGASLAGRSIVLVGMMGAGKTTLGRRLAARLGLPFIDADAEIERAAGQSIADIFSQHGEAAFRAGEEKVIARLLDGAPQVIATGGGAFMNERTRARILEQAIAVWLRAEFGVLMERVRRRNHRPLLRAGDPEQVMRTLMDERYPVYQLAPVIVQSRDVPHDVIVTETVDALKAYLDHGEHGN